MGLIHDTLKEFCVCQKIEYTKGHLLKNILPTLLFQYPPFVIDTKGVDPGFDGYCRKILDVLADEIKFR